MRRALAVVAALVALAGCSTLQKYASILNDNYTCSRAKVVGSSRAIAACTKVMAKLPDTDRFYRLALERRAVAYAESGQFEKARIDLERLRVLAPLISGHAALLAAVDLRLDRVPAALAAANDAVRLAPRFRSGYIVLGTALDAVGRFAEAEKAETTALTLDPGNATALSNRCLYRAEIGHDLAGALGDCSLALQAEPHDVLIAHRKGYAFYRAGDYSDAIAESTRAPMSAFSYYVRGLAKNRSGDRTSGATDMAVAKILDREIAKTLVP